MPSTASSPITRKRQSNLFCLECGTKINDDELQCPRCGSSVVDMKARIAAAEEQIVYTDAVSPSSTSKLPLVKDRSYQDRDGKPLDLSQEVDVASLHKDENDLTAIPELGADDPFITMPMQRIVADSGKVVADVDRDAKVYRQGARRAPFPMKPFLGGVVIILVILAAWSFAPQVQDAVQRVLQTDSQKAASSVPTASQTTSSEVDSSHSNSYSEEDFEYDLTRAYQDLSSWRTDVDSRVEDLEGYFLVTNKQTRQGYADSCNATIQDITSSRESLGQLCQRAGVSHGSSLYGKYQQIDELYGYLLDRLDVVSQCWEISLSYDNPKSYSSMILSPLAADLSYGNSISETSFDKLYPNANPEE